MAFSKARGEREPEAYPQGYVEDSVEPRKTLKGVFTILSRLVKTVIQLGRRRVKTGGVPSGAHGATNKEHHVCVFSLRMVKLVLQLGRRRAQTGGVASGLR